MSVTIQFRLEKVSRRKDGQRFKVLFEIDDSNPNVAELDIEPVFCQPIVVYSKRKPEMQPRNRTKKRKQDHSPESDKRMRSSSPDSCDNSLDVVTFLEDMEERMLDMMSKVQDAIENRLDNLESRLDDIEMKIEEEKDQSEGDLVLDTRDVLLRFSSIMSSRSLDEIGQANMANPKEKISRFQSGDKNSCSALEMEMDTECQNNLGLYRFTTADLEQIVAN